MSNYNTYSFNDIIAVFGFSGFPTYPLNGQGLGEIAISYINANTAHELAADGTVMITKVFADNGNITVTCQQTSPLHHFFKQVYNFLSVGASALWAANYITISSPAGTFDSITCAGMSFTKRADQPYQQQGQMVSWPFMSANIQYQF